MSSSNIGLPVEGMSRASCVTTIEAINLSNATFRKIKQNLFWAFFYNVVMIPLAMIGWMHPVLAEVAMAISSTSVVGNANLLRRVDIQPSYLCEPESTKDEVRSATLPAAGTVVET